MRARIVVLLVDNIGVIYNLVGGLTRFTDTGSIVHAWHLWLNDARPLCWFEHIPSWTNLADGGSRVDISSTDAKAAGVPMRNVQLPNLPSTFPRVSITD
jgi:hypothetical protein